MRLTVDDYICPIHGTIKFQHTIRITLDGRNDHYCLRCWAAWFDANITKVEVVV